VSLFRGGSVPDWKSQQYEAGRLSIRHVAAKLWEEIYFGDEKMKIYMCIVLNSLCDIVSLRCMSGKEAIILKEIYCVPQM
jgi:hypothetical protein